MAFSSVRVALIKCFIVLYYFLEDSQSYIMVPELNDRVYVEEGDLNIGGIFSITAYDPTRPCGDKINDFLRIELVESMVYAIKKINEDQNILPGIKLGFVIVDACNKETTAVVQALRFLPKSNPEDYNKSSIFRATPGHISRSSDPDRGPRTSDIPRLLQAFKVIGIIGPDHCASNEFISRILGPFSMPLMNLWCTGGKLLNQDMHPLYFGLESSHKYQVVALMKYMILQNWLHFSVIYEDSVAGERYFEQLKANVVDYEMCIVSSRLVSLKTNFIVLLDNLLRKDEVYITVFLGDSTIIMPEIKKATEKLGAHGKLLWITAGHWHSLQTAQTTIPGSLVVSFIHRQNDGFTYHFQTIDPQKTKNPWFFKAFEDIFVCPDDTCIYNKQRDPSLYGMSQGAHVQDAVYAYALALNTMIKEKCDNGDRVGVVRCFLKNAKLYKKYLRSINFTGRTGAISFKPNFVKSEYVAIFQALIQSNSAEKSVKAIAVYDSEYKLTTVLDNLSWKYFTFPKENVDINFKCRPTCGPHHFKQKDESCCWTCHKCQDNEIISKIGTLCDACQPLFWPLKNDTKITECTPIIPDVFDWLSVTPVSFITCAILGIIIVLSVMCFYKTYRANILIQSSNLELSVIQLLSIVWGYSAVPLLINHNSSICCNVGIFLFNISFYALYATMLIKAIKLYKVFNFSKVEDGSKKSPRNVDLVVFWLFFLSVVVTLMFLHVNFPLVTSISQPDPSVQYAEIACSVPLPYVIAFLGASVCLLFVCFIVSFMTVSVPNTFRETRFVNMCALITLVMWLAFMPSYFTAIRPQMKMYFIALMVLLNHGITIFFLFLPRIATILYLGETVRKVTKRSDELDSYIVQVPVDVIRLSVEEQRADKKLNFRKMSIVDDSTYNECQFEPFTQSPQINKIMDAVTPFTQDNTVTRLVSPGEPDKFASTV